MRWLIIILLLSTTALAQTIADYPYFFFDDRIFNGYVVKGDIRHGPEIMASNLVIEALPRIYNPVYRVTPNGGYNFFRPRADPASVIDNVHVASEVKFLDKPAILVGTPCGNTWVKRVMRVKQCNFIPAGRGLVLLGTYEGQLVLVITGGTPEDVLAAAEWLHSSDHLRMFGTVAIITTNGYSTVRPIGNGDLLTIGRPLQEVTPLLAQSQYRVPSTRVNTYLRYPGGRVVFGERD